MADSHDEIVSRWNELARKAALHFQTGFDSTPRRVTTAIEQDAERQREIAELDALWNLPESPEP